MINDNYRITNNNNNSKLYFSNKKLISPKNFISLYSGLPLYFIPSFIRKEQKLLKLLSSKILAPKKDISGKYYEDIILDIDNTGNKKDKLAFIGRLIFKPIETKITTKIEFEEAKGITSPPSDILNDPSYKLKIVGTSIKICFYDKDTKKFFGNAISIDTHQNKGDMSKWVFDDSKSSFNNNIIIRYNDEINEHIILVFEFVISILRDGFLTDVSCGWSYVDLKNLTENTTKNLTIFNGTPDKPIQPILIDKDKKKSTTFTSISSLYIGNSKNLFSIKIKTLNKMNDNDKQIINYLPNFCLIHRASLNLITCYRKRIADLVILMKDYGNKKIQNDFDLVNKFCQIVNCPDAFKNFTDLWNLIVVEGATNAEKKDEKFSFDKLESFVNKIYSALYSENFKFNYLDPTFVPLGDNDLMNMRNKIIRSLIFNSLDDKKKKYKNEVYPPVDELTKFKPFSIYEINQGSNLVFRKFLNV